VTQKQLQAKLDRLTEKIEKGRNQLDAWRMERKELRLKLADSKRSGKTGKPASRARIARAR
jgi:hypothetical protein